jgi:hypothetical protein
MPSVGPMIEELTMRGNKAEGERAIFRRFAAKSGLDVKPKSIRSRKVPRPDISCRVGEKPLYFEITRMVHRGSANRVGRHLSELAQKGTATALTPDIYDDRAALRETIERKADKRYETEGRPIALLVFIDGVFHPPRMPVSWAKAVLEKEGPKGRWNSIWLYDVIYDKVIASWYGCDNATQQAAGTDR